MQFARAARGVASACLLSVLAACGGGGGGDDDKSPNTLTILNAGDAGVATGIYTLDTTYTGVTGSIATSFGTLEITSPEHPAFDTGLMYVRGGSDKYFVGLWDNEGTGNAYSCRSNNWTTLQLQELELLLDDNTISSVPVCNKSVTLQSGKRRIQFTNLILQSDASAGTVTVNGDFTWAAP